LAGLERAALAGDSLRRFQVGGVEGEEVKIGI
jgi:hypothetical protein